MSKDVIINGTTYSGVSEVELPISGGTAKFKDEDEISTSGWTPKVASGTFTGNGTQGATITHNMGTKNIIIFIFTSNALNGGTQSSWKSLWGFLLNPEIFFNSGYKSTYDCSGYNTNIGENGVITMDWSTGYGGIGLHFKAPYVSTATKTDDPYGFNDEALHRTSDTIYFNENECKVFTSETYGMGVTYYWYAYELPTFTSSQKLSIGTATTEG